MSPFSSFTLLYIGRDKRIHLIYIGRDKRIYPSSFFIYRVLYFDYYLKINNCDSCTAKLYMLICIMGHIRDAAQILADELSEDTIAFHEGYGRVAYLPGWRHR